MSELVDSDVNDNSETARTPLSGICCYNEPLDADSIDDPSRTFSVPYLKYMRSGT